MKADVSDGCWLLAACWWMLAAAVCWLFALGSWVLDVDCCCCLSLAVDCWLLVAGCWLRDVCCWLVAGCYLLADARWDAGCCRDRSKECLKKGAANRVEG